MIQAVLFDLGYTLVDGPAESRLIGEAMAAAGLAPSPQAGRERVWELEPKLNDRIDLMPGCDALNAFHADLSRLIGVDVNTVMEGFAAKWEPFPEAKRVLAEVRARGYRIGLVSNWGPTGDDVLDHTGLRPFMETVVFSYACGRLKPEPGIFRLAAERLGVAPEGCLMVGDSLEADIWGALGAGLHAYWVNRDGRPGPSMTHSGRDLESLLEMLPPLPRQQERVG